MKKSLLVSKQRVILKQQINEIIENTFPAKVLQLAGSLFQRLIRRPDQLPWYISTIILCILAILPQLIIALVSNALDQIIGYSLLWSVSAEMMALSIPIIYFLLRYILINTRDHIIDDIETNNNLADLQKFLLEIGKPRKTLLVVLLISVIWPFIALPLFSKQTNINPGIVIDVWIGSCVLGLILYFIFWYMRFPGRLANYEYRVYKLDPTRSQVINHISNILTFPFFVGAFFQGILFIIGLRFFKDFFGQSAWFVAFAIFLVWIPLIIHFVNSQMAINNIITSAKWRMLNELQDQIHKQYANPKLYLTENIESINKLMDLYERLHNTYNSRLAISRALSLFNQLLLPVLGLLISNLDSVMKFFGIK